MKDIYGYFSIFVAIRSWHVKLRIIHNWARYMISYFNPHYRFRGWAIIEDIISDWFTIFSIFILCKIKVIINILKRKWIESNQKFTYFFPSPKQQKLNQILLSLNVWSLKICSRRNETNFHPTIDKQNSAWNKQLTQEKNDNSKSELSMSNQAQQVGQSFHCSRFI